MAEGKHDVVLEPDCTDRGLLDGILGKKPHEELIASELEKVHVSEPEEKKHSSLVDKLHRSDSTSSSSSSDEEVEGGCDKKKKKKKGMKENVCGVEGEEDKKGFLDKIKEKLPGVHKKASEDVEVEEGGESKEKKGIFEKIKEKIPGCHKGEEKKDE